MKSKDLYKYFVAVCNLYAITFCEKQEMDFNGWIGDEIGGIAECNDFYFNLHDIVLDLRMEQPKGSIIDWYYDNLEYENKHINYSSYINGLRISDILE